jgi:conjugal transfer/type IV secretion protein DotA/TraY
MEILMNRILLLFFSIVIQFFTTTANAEGLSPDMMVPRSTDWFLINFIDKYINPDNVSVLSGPMLIFLYFIMFLAGILAAYTLIAGTMATAHDGEMLGKKWSSMWLPIRTVLGTAMIMPVSNGFAVIHFAIYKMIFMGVGVAGWLVPVAVLSLTNLMSHSSVSADMEVRKLAKDTILGTACVQLYNDKLSKYLIQSRNSGYPETDVQFYSVQNFEAKSEGKRVVGYNFGGSKDFLSGNKTQTCGFVRLEITSEGELQKELAEKAGYNPLVDVASVQAAVQEAQAKALANMTQAAMNYAPTLIKTDSANAAKVNEKVEELTQAYKSEMKQAAIVALIKANNVDAVNEISEKGWSFLGAYYMKIVQAINNTNAAVNSVPSSSGQAQAIESDSLSYSWYGSFMNAYDRLQAMLKDADAYNADTTDLSGQDSSLFTKLIKGFSSNGGVFTGDGNVDQLLSITQQINVGNHVLNSVGAAGIFVSSASLLALIPKVSDVIIAAGTIIGPFFSIIMIVGLVNGIMLAYVIPMIPYVIWIGVVVSYMAVCIEAMIAAPMWVMAHLSPDADDVVGKQGQGYMLSVILTMKPPLAVFGFIASFIIMSVGAMLINATFLIATSFVNSGWLGLTYTIAMTAVYMTLNLNNTMNATRVMTTLPDSILEWLGARSTSLSGKVMGGSEQAVQNAKSNTSEVGQKVGHAMSHSLSSGMKTANKIVSPPPKKGNDDGTNEITKGNNDVNSASRSEPKGNNGKPLSDL